MLMLIGAQAAEEFLPLGQIDTTVRVRWRVQIPPELSFWALKVIDSLGSPGVASSKLLSHQAHMQICQRGDPRYLHYPVSVTYT